MPSPPSSPQHARSDDSPNGLFRQGVWLCNCQPRLRATVRHVTRNTKNKGKRFYCCPTDKNEGNRCDMFLLVEDAQRREREHLMSNGRSEKRKDKKQTTLPERFTPRTARTEQQPATGTARSPGREVVNLDDASTASSTSSPSPESADIYDTTSSEEDEDEEDTPTNHATSSTGSKSLQPSAMARTTTTSKTGSKRPSDDEDLLDDLSASGAEEMVAATERSTKTAIRSGKQREEAYMTPTTTRTTDIQHGMPTPLTAGQTVKKLQFDLPVSQPTSSDNHSRNPSPKRQRLNETEGARLFGTDKTISSPPSHQSRSESPTPGQDLTGEVMSLLQDEDISFATRNAVRKTLQRYVSQAKGYERGRDVSRKAVKDAEDRNAQLQARIDDLEQARQGVRGKLMDLWHQT
ncbi:hypothetical protein F5Y03DRAFT_115535 [Xylaria venustula]|nr:hypothetical protein F5Y03DRAFT_115535 [Xylaria venustula]